MVSCAVDMVAHIYETDHPTSLSDSLVPEPMTYYAHFSVYMCNYGISMVYILGEKMSSTVAVRRILLLEPSLDLTLFMLY